VVAKNIVYTFTSYDNLHSSKAIAQVLRVDRKNIKRGVERCVLLDIVNEAF
jgi:transcription initiation factor TFIIIB Brf1 subunit/transcription initiation factor TFIIB